MLENLQEIKFHLQQGILAIEALEKLQDKPKDKKAHDYAKRLAIRNEIKKRLQKK